MARSDQVIQPPINADERGWSSDRRHAQVREVLHFSSLVGHHNRGNRENFDGALGIDVEPNLSAADREALVADAPNAGWLLLRKEPAERRRENRRVEFHKLRVGSNRKLLALLRNQQREEIIPATSCLSPFATATFSFDRNELTASTIPEGREDPVYKHVHLRRPSFDDPGSPFRERSDVCGNLGQVSRHETAPDIVCLQLGGSHVKRQIYSCVLLAVAEAGRILPNPLRCPIEVRLQLSLGLDLAFVLELRVVVGAASAGMNELAVSGCAITQ